MCEKSSLGLSRDASNAFWAIEDHVTGVFPHTLPCRRSLSGANIFTAFGRNLLWKLSMPRYLRKFLAVVGF